MIVADSDVLIDALRGREPSLSRIHDELGAGTLVTTVVNAFELLSGAGSDQARHAVEALLAPLAVLPLDAAAARAAADVRLVLEQAGQKIGMADYLIAGICLSTGASLLTRNRAHFERVPGLVLEV